MFITKYILRLFGGIITGICISVPIGPTGILCLRKVLEQERRAGVVTGIGAILDDPLYAIIAYLFTGIMLGYVGHNGMILRIMAGMLSLASACYLYSSTPRLGVSQCVIGQINQRNLSRLGSGFLLAIPSLFIVPVYIVLFSQFNFVRPLGAPPYKMFALGLISIALGALGWWLFITYAATRLRDLVSLHNLQIFDRIFTLILAMIVITSPFYTFVAL